MLIRRCCLRRSSLVVVLLFLFLVCNLVLFSYIKIKFSETESDSQSPPIELNTNVLLSLQSEQTQKTSIETSGFPFQDSNFSDVPDSNFSDIPDIPALIDSPLFRKHGIHLEWIATRIRQDWNEWTQAYRIIRKLGLLEKISRKRILLYLGLMEIKMGEDALKGGPVGELVQWSNLIVCLLLLNYPLEIVVDQWSFNQLVNSQEFDLIFTDLIGINRMSEALLFRIKCKLRILDSFGTEPEFNIRKYSDIPALWEKWNFEDTRQMLTLFPHTPDNSFLGFMIPTAQHKVQIKKKIAVIYGKERSYIDFLKENRHVLKIVSEYLEIHTTMKEMPENLGFPVVNHGVLAYDKLLELLSESLLFVGLGFPFNGPGPLDAIAEGCIFLQPRFSEGKNRWTDDFFKGKPTSLTYHSQHPYLEQFVGDPWVHTVDYANESVVRILVENIFKQHLSSSKSVGFMPHEFTAAGFLERVGVLVENLVTCERGNLAIEWLADVRLTDQTSDKKRDEEESFAARKMTDGRWGMNSCYHMRGERGNHDVCVVFDVESVVWVWKVVIRLLPTWEKHYLREVIEGGVSEFTVSLLNREGDELMHEKFKIDRVSYEMMFKNVSGVQEVCVSIDTFSEFVICELEVYGQESLSQMWPSRSQMNKVVGERGQSCKSTCQSSGMICARNLFHVLDSLDEVELSMGANCGNNRKLMIPGPGLEITEKDGKEYIMCILNRDSMLYSCAAVDSTVQRLCPCVPLHPGQNGLPIKHYSFEL